MHPAFFLPGILNDHSPQTTAHRHPDLSHSLRKGIWESCFREGDRVRGPASFLPTASQRRLWRRRLQVFLSGTNTSPYRLRLALTGETGLGVVAGSAIPAAARIHRMGGRRVDLQGCVVEIQAGRIGRDDPLQVAEDVYFILDAFSICFNHSCDPNAGIRGEGELFALRGIAPGEEITFDYSTTVPPWVSPCGWRMACRCQCAGCRHEIGNVLTLPASQLAYYRANHAMPDYILRALPGVHPEEGGSDFCLAQGE